MIPYFHGTRSTFKSFAKAGSGQHGRGFYFTRDFNDARAFAYTLAGSGDAGTPKVYRVSLTIKNAFDSMSIEDARYVAETLGFTFKVPKKAGGAMEHYHHLAKQMVQNGVASKETVNDRIRESGFDAICCDFLEHMIVFDEHQIEILSVEEV